MKWLGLGENEITWEEEDEIPISLIASFNGRQQDDSLQEFLKEQMEKFRREEMSRRRIRSAGTAASDGEDHGEERSIRRNSGTTAGPSRAKKARYSGKEPCNDCSNLTSESMNCSVELGAKQPLKSSNCGSGQTGPSKAKKGALKRECSGEIK